MKRTETNCPLVFEAILHDSTQNTRRMLKLFSLPIARLHSGGHHGFCMVWRQGKTVITFVIKHLEGIMMKPKALRWFLFITHYYIAQIGTPTDKVSILR